MRRRIGGRLAQRTREVIDIPAVPAQATEHVFIARICPLCEQRRTPRADLAGVALGKQRLGINLVSLIAALREEARLPYRTIQWYLQTVHQLSLSVGTLVGVIRRVARQAQGELGSIRERIRGSPVVHADETGWRENGVNGYVWTFSTPTERYFLRRGRNKEVVDEALGEDFAGRWSATSTPPTITTTAPSSAAGRTCCGRSMTCAHSTLEISNWPNGADAVHRIYRQATAFSHTSRKQRRAAQLALEKRLLALCRPCLDDPLAVQGKLCRRIDKHLKELFVLRGRTGSAPGQQRRRAQPTPPGDQPQDQRRHPLATGHRDQDGPGFPLRHLARPGPKSPHRLPPTTHFPQV